MAEHLIAPFRKGEGYDDEKIPELIDEWISCSIDTGNEKLNALVKEVNCHTHTKSCKKGASTCRFNFPRFPSKKTLIASPISEDLSEEDEKKQIADSKAILDVVKTNLEGLTDEVIEATYNNDIDVFLET